MISFFLEHITKCQWCLIWLSFDFVCMLCLWRSSTSMDTLCVFKCAWSRQRLHRHKHTRTLILLFYPWFTLVAHTLVSTCHSSSSGGFVFIAFYMFFTELTSPESAQFFFILSPVVCVLSCPLCVHKHKHTHMRMSVLSLPWLAFAFICSVFRFSYLLWSGCKIWALALIKKGQRRWALFFMP